LACAWKIPERLTRVGVFAPMGPLLPETTDGLVPSLVKLYRLAPEHPAIVRAQMALMAAIAKMLPAVYSTLIAHEFSLADRETYGRLRVADWIGPDRLEFYRQWGRGVAYDVTIPATWPIPLSEIAPVVHLWQGELDVSVSPTSSRYLARTIPDCRATFIPDAGHFWIFEHMGDVLATLVPAAETSP